MEEGKEDKHNAKASTNSNTKTQPVANKSQWTYPMLEETDQTRTQRQAEKAPKGILSTGNAIAKYDP